MGLDIAAYSGLTKCAQDDDVPSFVAPRNHKHFRGRADEIEPGARYTWEKADGFRAGSYGGYNNWREQLAKLAGYPAVAEFEGKPVDQPHSAGAWSAAGGPFWELIEFTDCDGILGASVCGKLLMDFREFDERAKAIGGWFYDRYVLWAGAALLASQGGAIVFE